VKRAPSAGWESAISPAINALRIEHGNLVRSFRFSRLTGLDRRNLDRRFGE